MLQAIENLQVFLNKIHMGAIKGKLLGQQAKMRIAGGATLAHSQRPFLLPSTTIHIRLHQRSNVHDFTDSTMAG